jgi:hypothetical protein
MAERNRRTTTRKYYSLDDNVEVSLSEIYCVTEDCIYSACEHDNKSLDSIKHERYID